MTERSRHRTPTSCESSDATDTHLLVRVRTCHPQRPTRPMKHAGTPDANTHTRAIAHSKVDGTG
jgi:hypothetical protein